MVCARPACPQIRLLALGESLLRALLDGIRHLCGCHQLVEVRFETACKHCSLGSAWLLVHSAADLLHTCQGQLQLGNEGMM